VRNGCGRRAVAVRRPLLCCTRNAKPCKAAVVGMCWPYLAHDSRNVMLGWYDHLYMATMLLLGVSAQPSSLLLSAQRHSGVPMETHHNNDTRLQYRIPVKAPILHNIKHNNQELPRRVRSCPAASTTLPSVAFQPLRPAASSDRAWLHRVRAWTSYNQHSRSASLPPVSSGRG